MTPEIDMLSQLNTLTTANAFVVFTFALLFTGHVCLFFDLSRFQKQPLSNLNYVNSGILSALITTGSFYTVRLSSMTHKMILIAAIGLLSATAITLTIQRLSNRLFNSEKTSGQTVLKK
jgi:hypothetical protein